MREDRGGVGPGKPLGAGDGCDLAYPGLCDAGEGHILKRSLASGHPARAEVFAAHGDLRTFRTIQQQPAWRGKDETAQLRRFLGAGSQRKLRYARLLTETISLDRIPQPLAALLTAI